MFDKTIRLTSSDGSVSLIVVAGTEGLKSLTLSAKGVPVLITPQTLMDVCAPAIKEWLSAPPSSAAPGPPSS